MRHILFVLFTMGLGLVTLRGDEPPGLPLPKDIKEMNVDSDAGWMLSIQPDGSGHLTFDAENFAGLRQSSAPFSEIYKKLKAGLKVQNGPDPAAIYFSTLDQHNVCHTFVVSRADRAYVLQLMQTALGNIESNELKKEFSQILKDHPFLPPPAK
jgi:hypothetical protein